MQRVKDFGYPILSEEGKSIAFETRNSWEYFWLIDPLDGTKEFIKKNGEFTVNIALIHNGVPVMGVVYVPVTKQMFFASKEEGAKTFTVDGDLVEKLDEYLEVATRLPMSTAGRPYTVVSSRTHSSPETEAFIQEKTRLHGDVNLINAGSSLKLCLVAEGKGRCLSTSCPYNGMGYRSRARYSTLRRRKSL